LVIPNVHYDIIIIRYYRNINDIIVISLIF